MKDTLKIGRDGERLAAKYLKKNGYKILHQNYSTKIGEIDIVAKHGDCIVFVEVKTRVNKYNSITPSDSVTITKQKRYGRLADYYTKANNCYDVPMRFDVIEITGKTVNHIINAFEFLR